MERFTEIFKEGGVYSLTRILPTLGYAVFILVSLFLALLGKRWENYGEFAMATGGAVVVQLGNKWINSKYNTAPGEAGKQLTAKGIQNRRTSQRKASAAGSGKGDEKCE